MGRAVKPLKLNAEHCAVAGALALAGGLAWYAMRGAGGAPMPRFSEEVKLGQDPHTVFPSEHFGDTVWTRHRYPVRVGGEITAIIHNGFAAMRVPQWPGAEPFVNPPSEAGLS